MRRLRGGLIVAATLATGISMGAFVAHAIDQPHMDAALGHLRQARESLQQAAANKGGHRANAINLINQAIQEVRLGIQYANQHPNQGQRRY